MVVGNSKIFFSSREGRERVHLFSQYRPSEGATLELEPTLLNVFECVHGFHLYVRNNVLAILSERAAWENFNMSAFDIDLMDVDTESYYNVDFHQHIPEDFTLSDSVVSDVKLTNDTLVVHLFKISVSDVQNATLFFSLSAVMESQSSSAPQTTSQPNDKLMYVVRSPPHLIAEEKIYEGIGFIAVNDKFLVVEYNDGSLEATSILLVKQRGKGEHGRILLNTGYAADYNKLLQEGEMYLEEGPSGNLIYLCKKNDNAFLLNLDELVISKRFSLGSNYVPGNWLVGVFNLLTVDKAEGRDDNDHVFFDEKRDQEPYILMIDPASGEENIMMKGRKVSFCKKVDSITNPIHFDFQGLVVEIENRAVLQISL